MAEFQELLLRTYGVALAESSDQHLEFLPLRAGAVSNPVTVDARFEQPGTPPPGRAAVSHAGSRWKMADL